jgi:hypothetical protein
MSLGVHQGFPVLVSVTAVRCFCPIAWFSPMSRGVQWDCQFRLCDLCAMLFPVASFSPMSRGVHWNSQFRLCDLRGLCAMLFSIRSSRR